MMVRIITDVQETLKYVFHATKNTEYVMVAHYVIDNCLTPSGIKDRIMKILNNLKSSLKDINGATYINGVKIDGAQSVIIDNGKVYVNGKLQEDISTPSIEIKVEGNVGSITTTSGNVSVNGDVRYINTSIGDVDCHEVKGGVLTMSGDVTCGDIAGGVSTMSGNVYHK